MLVPLYLLMVADLKLDGVRAASLIVTIYGAVYCLGSYAAGVLSDRFDRKILLSIGLLGNAASIAAMGFTRDYFVIVALSVAAGLFGTLFHPTANALAPSHYPKTPGLAIGLLSAGSGLGFFFGPLIAGWRAHAATWHFDDISQWQKPCVELGIAGFALGLIFLMVGNDPEKKAGPEKIPHVDPSLRNRVLKLASLLMFRDFCGVGVISLGAIYLQRVFHITVEQAGWMVGLMMLPSVLFNPLFVYLSPGTRRLPALTVILIVGGLIIVTTPLWGATMALPILCAFQTLQMGSYAVSDAAMLERVPPQIRGRVVGLFMIIAGTFGALAPWVLGAWTDFLGTKADQQSAYFGPFGLLAIFMLLAAMSSRQIRTLGPPIDAAPIQPLTEITPATMGVLP